MKTDLVGIFRQGDDAFCAPAFFLTRDEARALKDLDQGFFINHGRDMRLIEGAETIAADNGIRFSNPHQSRDIKPHTVDEAIRRGVRDRSQIARFDFMRGRLRPLAVVAVESWA